MLLVPRLMLIMCETVQPYFFMLTAFLLLGGLLADSRNSRTYLGIYFSAALSRPNLGRIFMAGANCMDSNQSGLLLLLIRARRRGSTSFVYFRDVERGRTSRFYIFLVLGDKFFCASFTGILLRLFICCYD